MSLHPKLFCEQEFRVRTYDVDKNKFISPPGLVKLMHETAMQNVMDIKLSVWDMEVHHLAWVLMRKNLIIHRLPILGEKMKVLTHPAGFEKYFTYRDYRIFGENGDAIAEAASTWLLMDTKTRRMTRIPDFILEFEMPDINQCLPRPKNKLPKFTEAHHTKFFKVGFYNLDFNEHLSNVFYLQWMLESLPVEVLGKSKLKRMDLMYRAECMWNDEIESQVQKLEDGSYLHRLFRITDKKELAVGQSYFS